MLWGVKRTHHSRKEQVMDAERMLVRQRLSLLELAKSLGNASEACRRRGISRTQFYEYRPDYPEYPP